MDDAVGQISDSDDEEEIKAEEINIPQDNQKAINKEEAKPTPEAEPETPKKSVLKLPTESITCDWMDDAVGQICESDDDEEIKAEEINVAQANQKAINAAETKPVPEAEPETPKKSVLKLPTESITCDWMDDAVGQISESDDDEEIKTKEINVAQANQKAINAEETKPIPEAEPETP